MKLRTPEGDIQLPMSAVGHPSEIAWQPGDVVILAMKTQDTEPALRALESAAGPDIPVFCAQNGVENERLVARRFANTYAMLAALPATHLVPGEVIASGSPLSGCLHSGRWPGGIDNTVEAVCEALRASHFHADPSADVMALKYRKLILNLANGLEVVTGRPAWGATGATAEFAGRLRDEALACYAAANIAAVSAGEYAARVQAHYKAMPVGGEARAASSTLQSIMRGHTVSEVDYLNGEIVMLGKLLGVPTPCNTVVRDTANHFASLGTGPGSMTVEELLEKAGV